MIANNDDVPDTGEVITNAGNTAFSFGVTRDFVANTDILRHEVVDYWIVLEEVADATNIHYFIEGGDSEGYAAQQIEAVFSEEYTSTELVGEAGSEITWDLDYANSFDTYPAGDYTLSAYIQDNAGNIRKSAEETITNTDEFLYSSSW